MKRMGGNSLVDEGLKETWKDEFSVHKAKWMT